MIKIHRRTAVFALLSAAVALESCKRARAERDAADDAPDQIALDAYVYGYPLVTIDQTRRVMTNVVSAADKHAPMGQFANATSYPDASFREITAPNANTLYSTAWLDLGAEPIMLSLPEEHGRYYLMPLLDAWTNVFHAPGTRTTGTGPQHYVIIGPHVAATPKFPGATIVRSPTDLVWIVGRTFAENTPADLNAVRALQRQYTLTPLNAIHRPYTPPPGRVDSSVDMKTAVRDQVNALDATTFFNRLAQLMPNNPPAPADSVIVARMATIGIVPGRAFDASKLGADASSILKRLPDRAMQRIMAVAKQVPTVNGWLYSTKIGTYGTDYDARAYTAVVGLGANLPQDAVYPLTSKDGIGRPLDGDNRYVLHFDKDRIPPVKGFWSLTMYDTEYFFVDNPLHRYQISPKQSPVDYNSDGSLDLYIQHDAPIESKMKNWLPAPTGKFVLMLRLYWPEESVVNHAWRPPTVTQTGSAAAQ